MRSITGLLLGLTAGWGPLVAAGAEPRPSGDPDILPPDSRLERLWSDGEFTEGVAAAPDGTIYFSDIPSAFDEPGRVLRFDPETGETAVHCRDSGKSNGLMFDARGRLIAACGANNGKRALCEVTRDGRVRVIAGEYRGRPFNSPNDLVIHPDGSIYFSDPRYVGPEPLQHEQQSVYRYAPQQGAPVRVTASRPGSELPVIEKPNGVHVSPDGKTLYVAETNNGSTGLPDEPAGPQPGRMTLNALEIKPDGTLGNKRVLVDFGDQTGVDGMTLDEDGNIYAAVRAEERHGILVYSPDGRERASIPTEPLPTNCCFGRGEESKTLYVTAGRGLYRIRLKVEGFHPAARD